MKPKTYFLLFIILIVLSCLYLFVTSAHFQQKKSDNSLIVKVFFGNTIQNPQVYDCSLVYPVNRTILRVPNVAQKTLEELLKGPTEEEKKQGYFSSINPGVKINSINIKNGIAYVDFDSTLEYAVGGSCRVAAIRSEITTTLKQFPTIKEVIISINGRTEDILQP